MKTRLRPLLLCAALAASMPLAPVAVAETSPEQKAAPAPAAAVAPSNDSATPAAVPPSAESAPAPAQAPASTPNASSAAAERAATEAKSDSDLRAIDRPAEPATTTRPHGRRSSQNDRVTFGGDATLGKDETANSVVAIAGNATSEGEVTDSLVAIAGNARATGPVRKSVVAVLGNAYVDAKVGEVVSVLGNVELGPNAEVRGDVVSVGGTVKRDPQAIVRGNVPNVTIAPIGLNMQWLQSYLTNCLFKGRLLAFAPGLAWAWAIAVGFLVFYALIALLFGRQVEACAVTLETRPGGTIVTSLLTLLLTPILIVLLCITLVGIAVVPFLGIGLKIAGWFGHAVMLAWIGRRITRFFGNSPLAHPAVAVLLGGIIVIGLYLVPVVSFITHMLLGVLGLGVVVYTLILRSKRDKPPTIAAPVYVSGGPAPSASGFGGTAAGAAGFAAEGVPPLSAATVPPVGVSAVALPRAGFWIRTGALLIDIVLVGIVALALPRALHFHPPGFLLILAFYGAVLWKLKGTTVGGIICGLRVVRTDGREIDWATAAVRALGCFLSLVVVGLGFIWVAIDDEKQSWHDKIAGTTVVLARGTVSLV